MRFKLYERRQLIRNIKDTKPELKQFSAEELKQFSAEPVQSQDKMFNDNAVIRLVLSADKSATSVIWESIWTYEIDEDNYLSFKEIDGTINSTEVVKTEAETTLFSMWAYVTAFVYKNSDDYINGKEPFRIITQDNSYCCYDAEELEDGTVEYSYSTYLDEGESALHEIGDEWDFADYSVSNLFMPFVFEVLVPELFGPSVEFDGDIELLS